MQNNPTISGPFAEGFHLFVQVFSETLHFLEEDWGFSRWIDSVGTFEISMAYVKNDLAIAIEFDCRELIIWDRVYRWSTQEERCQESIGVLNLVPELSPRVNSEVHTQVKVIQKLRKRALQRYDRALIREWLVAEASLYALWLSYGGHNLIARARELLGLPRDM